MRKEIEELMPIKVIKRIIRNYGKGRVTYLKTFIRIFYTVIVLYLSEIYLFI